MHLKSFQRLFSRSDAYQNASNCSLDKADIYFPGKTNIDLLMKCCRADGLIIKPSRALTSTNQNMMKLAFPNEISGKMIV